MHVRLYKIIICTAGILLLIFSISECAAWGFFGHRRINRLAVFCLPPEMMIWFKKHVEFITEHAVDPDKRRYAVKEEGAHHFIDIDHYGDYPFQNLPRKWEEAVKLYSQDTLMTYGVVPWHALRVFYRLQKAFKKKDGPAILRYATYLGHYIGDACVPLHAHSNYDGQLTGQKGIHALWESEIPEMLADTAFNLWTGKARYIDNPGEYIWTLVLESAKAADTVLEVEKELLEHFPPGKIHAFINRKGQTVRSYSVAFTKAYNERLQGMVARRMRRAVHAASSLWYTAWIRAGQPDLSTLNDQTFDEEALEEFKRLDQLWHHAGVHPIRAHE